MNYAVQMRACGQNWEASKANKIHKNRVVRIKQAEKLRELEFETQGRYKTA